MSASGQNRSSRTPQSVSAPHSPADVPSIIPFGSDAPEADIERMAFYFPPQQTQTNAETAPGKLPTKTGGLRKPNGSGTK